MSFRNFKVPYMLAFSCMSIFVLWHSGVEFASLAPLRSARHVHIQTIRSINILLNNSISGGRTHIRSERPTDAPPLPNLTLDAQDTFYGHGCRENRYRKRLQKILQEWGALARRRNIKQYFICFGSFLGSVRNGDIVPYDSDMDVCMFRHDYHKLVAEESKRPVNLNDGKIHMLLQRHSPHPMPHTPRKDCKGNIVRSVVDDCAILDPHGRLYNGALIYMDIFMIEDHGTKLWDEYRDKFHDRNAILPVKPCRYLGLDTKCPNSTEKYLSVYYGKEYMVPHHVCKGGIWAQNTADARPTAVLV